MENRIIYDFGMNTGQDLPYYLRKAEVVVGVEANPMLCELVRRTYSDAIASKRLIVLNAALVEHNEGIETEFFVHKHDHNKSQLTPPSLSVAAEYASYFVPAMQPSEVIKAHGAPHYIKIDLEGYDHVVLRELFRAGIFPPYISAELHKIEVFAALVAAGYPSFNIVDAVLVGQRPAACEILTKNGVEAFRFQGGTSGPFGDDLSTPWLDAQGAFEELRLLGTGWRDLHASHRHRPSELSRNPLRRCAWPLSIAATRNAIVRSLCRKWSLYSAFAN